MILRKNLKSIPWNKDTALNLLYKILSQILEQVQNLRLHLNSTIQSVFLHHFQALASIIPVMDNMISVIKENVEHAMPSLQQVQLLSYKKFIQTITMVILLNIL